MPGDSEMATVAAAHAQEQEAGEEEGGDGADMCLLVDGSTKVCRPQLKKPTRNELVRLHSGDKRDRSSAAWVHFAM